MSCQPAPGDSHVGQRKPLSKTRGARGVEQTGLSEQGGRTF